MLRFASPAPQPPRSAELQLLCNMQFHMQPTALDARDLLCEFKSPPHAGQLHSLFFPPSLPPSSVRSISIDTSSICCVSSRRSVVAQIATLILPCCAPLSLIIHHLPVTAGYPIPSRGQCGTYHSFGKCSKLVSQQALVAYSCGARVAATPYLLQLTYSSCSRSAAALTTKSFRRTTFRFSWRA